MKSNRKYTLAKLIACFQAAMLDTGWVFIRDNPCRERKKTLSQKDYFETFDYVRLAQLELIAEHINHFSISGDCAELGVFRGYFAQKIQEFMPNRKLLLFDTFEGFDLRDIQVEKSLSPNSAHDDFSCTDIAKILTIFSDPNKLEIRKGFFPETARENDGPFAFVSLDVDLYQPTLEGLKFFYPRLSPGGVMLVHDYNNSRYPVVSKAVHEFFDGGVGFIPIPDKNGSILITKNS
jgi:O-methyltransferase